MMLKKVILVLIFLPSMPAWADKFELSEPLQFQGKTISGILYSKDIEGLYDLPVKLSEKPSENQLKLISSALKSSQTVKTCREYEKAKNDGYDADSTFDIAMESFFKRICIILDLLRVSKAPANKHAINFDDLKVLPTDLIPNLTGSSRKKLKQVDIKDKNLEAMLSKGLKKISASSKKLEFQYQGMKTILTEVARADFNKSGVEQVLVFKADYALEGSFHDYGYYWLIKFDDRPTASAIKIKQ